MEDKILEIEAYLDEHGIEEVNLGGISVNIHQEIDDRVHWRDIKRSGYITFAMLKYGDLVLWDSEEHEEIKPYEITYGLEDVIKEIWATLDI